MTAIPLAERETAVYRLFDINKALLYVGISCNPDARLNQHRIHQRWWPQVATWTVEWLPDRLAALKCEAVAIRVEGPLYNRDRPNPHQVSLPKSRPPVPEAPTEPFDYSEKAFTEALGADVMDHIRRSAAAAPPPSPEVVEQLRTIFAPSVALLSTRAVEVPSRA